MMREGMVWNLRDFGSCQASLKENSYPYASEKMRRQGPKDPGKPQAVPPIAALIMMP
jgi:hypothetical protein